VLIDNGGFMKLVRSLVLLTSIAVAGACGDDDDTTSPTIECEPTDTKVCIPRFEFDPEELTVDNGTSVTWENVDAITHTSTSNPNNPTACPDWDHVMSQNNTSPAVAFSPGNAVRCEYYCRLHATPTTGAMRGVVQVQ
jgi:plastocyanin